MKKLTTAALLSICICSPALAFDWSSKSIQVERSYHADQSIPYDPLSLDQQSSYQGDGGGWPDYQLIMKPVVSSATGKLTLDREFQVTCRSDGKALMATFDEKSVSEPWSVRFDSGCGSWIFTLVDTAKARRVPRAAPGERPLLQVERMTEAKSGMGRPVMGEAMTPTERVKADDATLVASGGRVISRTRLSPEATAALATLSERYGSDRAAIEAALISLNSVAPHGK
jgi:hypothetical protein